MQSFCGKEAAAWQREMDKIAIQHVLEVAECPSWGKYELIRPHKVN